MVTRSPKITPASSRRRPWIAILAVLLAAGPSLALAGSPGALVWVDLLTEDAAEARRFYGELFDWEIEANRRDGFTILRDGTPIAGITEIQDRLEENEAVWLVGTMVSDLAASVDTARRLGATVHAEIARIKGLGRHAIIEDLQGAPLLLVDPERQLGGAMEPANWVWTELWTHDPDAAAEFYGKVIGYEVSDIQRPDGPYRAFLIDQEPRAGLVHLENQEIDSLWVPYLAVEDLAAVVSRGQELGGRLLLAPAGETHHGRVALLEDPTGGAFFIYQLEEETP